MAKKKNAAAEGEGEGEAPKKSKKKLIIMIAVIVMIGGFVAKSVLLKPPPPTAKQVAYNAELAEATLVNLCASHNGLPAKPLPVEPGAEKEKPDAHVATTTTTEPSAAGPVDTLDPITINLAADHYLKVALALQIPAGLDPAEVAKTENWEAVALKTAIDSLSGRTITDLTSGRQKAEQLIGDSVCRHTEGEVLTVYFTDFVMQ